MVKLRDEQKAELIKQEKERRRIARLRQVRQQTATSAKVIREVVSQKKTEIMEEIRSQLHEHVVDLVVEKKENLKARTPRRSGKVATPHSKKKPSRRRAMTEVDVALAQKRNADAMRRLQNSKQREREEREKRLAKRKEAAEKANAIMRGIQVL